MTVAELATAKAVWEVVNWAGMKHLVCFLETWDSKLTSGRSWACCSIHHNDCKKCATDYACDH